MTDNQLELLIVEDNSTDVFLLQAAFQDSGLSPHFEVCENGDDALAYLHRNPPFENTRRPDLVILDLNLPKKNGNEVLEAIRKDPDLAQIPVLILTTAAGDSEVKRLTSFPKTHLFTKPFRFDGYKHVVQAIKNFWTSAKPTEEERFKELERRKETRV